MLGQQSHPCCRRENPSWPRRRAASAPAPPAQPEVFRGWTPGVGGGATLSFGKVDPPLNRMPPTRAPGAPPESSAPSGILSPIENRQAPHHPPIQEGGTSLHLVKNRHLFGQKPEEIWGGAVSGDYKHT